MHRLSDKQPIVQIFAMSRLYKMFSAYADQPSISDFDYKLFKSYFSNEKKRIEVLEGGINAKQLEKN